MSKKFSDAVKGLGTVTTEITGDIDKFVKESSKQVDDATKTAVKQHADLVLQTAIATAPEDTGKLKASLEIKLTHGGTRALIRAKADQAWYAFIVHFGSEKMTGRPWLYQASEQHAAALKPAIEQALKNGGTGGES